MSQNNKREKGDKFTWDDYLLDIINNMHTGSTGQVIFFNWFSELYKGD